MTRTLLLVALLAAPGLPALADPAVLNDYPTEARADYVFGCMAANGQTREALRRCSCSIDVIASVLSYERYVDAETVLSMRQISGERSVLFRDTQSSMIDVADMRRAQVEAEILCF